MGGVGAGELELKRILKGYLHKTVTSLKHCYSKLVSNISPFFDITLKAEVRLDEAGADVSFEGIKQEQIMEQSGSLLKYFFPYHFPIILPPAFFHPSVYNTALKPQKVIPRPFDLCSEFWE